MRAKDEDLMEKVLGASWDETLGGLFLLGEVSVGWVEGEATLLYQADAGCSVEEVLPSHCWEGGMAGLYGDTENQRLWPRCYWRGKCFLCPLAQREQDHQSCSILSCWFL